MKRKIVIMGTRRSGSTFIGKLLTNSSNAFAYVEEPFNPVRGIKNLNHLWYPYINQENQNSLVKTDLEKLLDLKSVKFKNSIVNDVTKKSDLNVSRLRVIIEIFKNKSKEPLIKRVLRVFFKSHHQVSYIKAKYSTKKYIVYKDALMSLAIKEVLRNKNAKVIFIYRNPLGFYYSMKRLNWAISSDHFFNQNELIKDYSFIKDLPRKSEIDKIINEWLIVNTVLFEQAKINNRILCVPHEKLALDPSGQIIKIFNWLEISEKINFQKINLFTDGKHETSKTKDVKRNSKKELLSWKGKISEAEIAHVLRRTQELFEKLNDLSNHQI